MVGSFVALLVKLIYIKWLSIYHKIKNSSEKIFQLKKLHHDKQHINLYTIFIICKAFGLFVKLKLNKLPYDMS